MKKIIALMLVVVLLAGIGFGSFAYAQTTDPGQLIAFDQPFRVAKMNSDTDSIAAYEELTGHYSWNLHIHNLSGETVNDPTISVESVAHPEWFPDVTFPTSWTHDPLSPGEKWYEVSALSTEEDLITFTLGYDCSRTMEPLEIPPGGGIQKVTIKVKPVDERYTSNPYMQIGIPGNVIAGSNQEPEGATAIVAAGQHVLWGFHDWALGTEYTFSIYLQVENPFDANLVHKPHINIYVETASHPVGEPGDSTTIYDEILGGDITYSVAPNTWQWDHTIGDCWQVGYEPLYQLLHEPML